MVPWFGGVSLNLCNNLAFFAVEMNEKEMKGEWKRKHSDFTFNWFNSVYFENQRTMWGFSALA